MTQQQQWQQQAHWQPLHLLWLVMKMMMTPMKNLPTQSCSFWKKLARFLVPWKECCSIGMQRIEAGNWASILWQSQKIQWNSSCFSCDHDYCKVLWWNRTWLAKVQCSLWLNTYDKHISHNSECPCPHHWDWRQKISQESGKEASLNWKHSNLVSNSSFISPKELDTIEKKTFRRKTNSMEPWSNHGTGCNQVQFNKRVIQKIWQAIINGKLDLWNNPEHCQCLWCFVVEGTLDCTNCSSNVEISKWEESKSSKQWMPDSVKVLLAQLLFQRQHQCWLQFYNWLFWWITAACWCHQILSMMNLEHSQSHLVFFPLMY